ncbi:hypothetical protein KHU50_004424 [Colletotrichum sp. SAR 10_65]|nr:hypothetical protein KHU50_004424 [Colletotrichum sp. SAR 10_65]KAI8242463.1 hypothetical protein K4K53_003784 [Colletotrichum sp. SAR 10_77]
MSEKGGRWNNVEFVTSLMMSFYNELKGDGLSKEKKDAIEVRLRGQGFEDVTWNGIRWSGKWNNPVLLESLVMAFHGLAKSADGLTKESKDAVVAKAHLWGFTDITWEGISLLDASSPLSTSSLVDPPYSSSRSSSSSLITKLFQIATMSRNVMRWTPEVDQQILIALIKTVNPTVEQYDTVLQNLQPCGYNFTVSALK